MTHDEIEALMERAVLRAFERIGIDAENAAETRADFAYLRRSRQRVEGLLGKVLLTILGVTLTAGLYAMWDGIKLGLFKH